MSVVGRIILRKIFVENDRDSVTETDISFLNKNVKFLLEFIFKYLAKPHFTHKKLYLLICYQSTLVSK